MNDILSEKALSLENRSSFIEGIVGEHLSSVEFVQDYVQFRFDGPTITAFVWPTVSFRGKVVRPLESTYKDTLCARIGHVVRRA